MFVTSELRHLSTDLQFFFYLKVYTYRLVPFLTKSCSDDGIHEELRELLKYLTSEVENLHFGSVLMTMHFFVVSMT